jgi:hypothetical protein
LFFVGFVQLSWPLRYSQSRLCSIDNRLVDALLSLLEFGFLEPVNPFEQE